MHDYRLTPSHRVWRKSSRSSFLISKTLVSNVPCLVRALHLSFASRNANPNSLKKRNRVVSRHIPQVHNGWLTEGLETGNSLLPYVPQLHRRINTHNKIRPLTLIKCRNHERQALFFRLGARDACALHTLSHRVYQPSG